MKINIKNFKCWHEKSVEIKDEGIILLSGKSGKGKSSILDAIYFCLFGNGQKVISSGKNNCQVSIEIDNIIITRTKKPNRLHLINNEGEYEDDVAQSIINEMFGELFDVVSYVKQNGFNTFLKMSPTEKLEFVERALFSHTNIADIKQKSKNYIKECNDNLVSCISRISTLKETVNTIRIPDKIDFPIKVKKEMYEKVEKNEKIKKKNCEILIQKNRVELEQLKLIKEHVLILVQSETNKKTNLQKYDEQLDSLILKKLKLEKEFVGVEEYEELIKIKTYIYSCKEVEKLKEKIKEDSKTYEELKEDEIQKNKTQIKSLIEKLWKENDRETTIENLSINKKYIEDLKKIKNLKLSKCKLEDISDENIEQLKEKIEKSKNELKEIQNERQNLIKSKDIHKCPHCEKNIIITENGLEKSEHLHIKDIDLKIKENLKVEKMLTEMIKKLDAELSQKSTLHSKVQRIDEDIKEIEEEYEGLSDVQIEDMDNLLEETTNEIKSDEIYLKNNESSEEQIKEIEKRIKNNIFTDSIKSLETKLSKLKIEFEKLTKNLDIIDTKNYGDKSIQDEIDIQNNLQNEINNTETQIKNYQILKNNTLKELEKEKYLFQNKYNLKEIPILIEIEEKLNKFIVEIDEIEEKYTKTIQNIEQIEKYNNYIMSKDNYDSLLNKLKDEEVKEKEYKNLLSGASMLKDKISEAQSIAIINFIQSLNMHVNLHLETFFKDDPMNIEIESFKEAKNNKGPSKPQINLKIDYKAMECEPASLSGGERDRLDLAFTLALSEIFGSRILLLDECISSLDYETSSYVLEGIKDNYKGKNIIVVSHQANEGFFDEVLNI